MLTIDVVRSDADLEAMIQAQALVRPDWQPKLENLRHRLDSNPDLTYYVGRLGEPRRHTSRLALILTEDVTAAAAPLPVVDVRGHSLDRKQRAPMPRMSRLSALPPPRPPRPARLPNEGGS